MSLGAQELTLAGGTAVDLKELSESEFILYGDFFALSDLVTNACAEVGFSPKVSGRSAQWDFMASLVNLGVGVTRLPKVFCDTFDACSFTVAEIQSPSLTWEISLACVGKVSSHFCQGVA